MDIKVGEYVRTNEGEIFKVGKINDDYYVSDRGLVGCFKEMVKSHSFDIIDLIEIGDYVNGHLVVAKNDNKIATEIAGLNGAILHWYKEKGIKLIVTKEQFKAMEYEV